MQRRRFLLSAALPALAVGREEGSPGTVAAAMDSTVFRRELCKEAIEIESLELLKTKKHFIVRIRDKRGAQGLADANAAVMRSAYPILLDRVFPAFAGKDARNLESLLHAVYVADSNYKWQGLPFWTCVAVTEIAILDLIGKVTGKPLGALIGDVWRKEIPVYRASSHRGNSPQEEIEYLRGQVAETGARAIKFRLGARMRFDAASTRRDEQLIPLTRKTFGSEFSIYADANGSYDVPMAIRMGRLMEEQRFAFFEEPVPFDYYDETRQIAAALEIPIALGEEEMSLRGFRRIIESRTARVIQPDLLYFGGLIRSMRVARMAAAAGLDCTPHMSGGGLGYLYIAHFASAVRNSGAHQEYKGEDEDLPVTSKTSTLRCAGGMLTVPSGPGLGIDFDPAFLAAAQTVRLS